MTNNNNPNKRPRLRKKDTPPEVWIAHKKARKKIASAKWYARVQSVRVAKRDEERTQRIEQEERERDDRLKRSLEDPAVHDMFECRWQHHVNHWPARPSDVPASDWVALLKMAEQSLSYVMSLPMVNQHPEKIQAFRRVCMQELEYTYRKVRRQREVYHYDDPLDEPAMEKLSLLMSGCCSPSTAATSSSSSSSACASMYQNNEDDGDDDDNGKGSGDDTWWNSLRRWRESLIGNTFPWTATWLGVVFVDLILRGRSHRWPGLLRYMYQLSHTNPAALPIQLGHNDIIHNPSHMPQSSPT